jgi:hypothetical protein
MFFLCRVDRVFRHKLHCFTATNQFTVTGVENLNNVSAEFAFVDFQHVCHIASILKQILSVLPIPVNVPDEEPLRNLPWEKVSG